jgi:hypothetical protein
LQRDDQINGYSQPDPNNDLWLSDNINQQDPELMDQITMAQVFSIAQNERIFVTFGTPVEMSISGPSHGLALAVAFAGYQSNFVYTGILQFSQEVPGTITLTPPGSLDAKLKLLPAGSMFVVPPSTDLVNRLNQSLTPFTTPQAADLGLYKGHVLLVSNFAAVTLAVLRSLRTKIGSANLAFRQEKIKTPGKKTGEKKGEFVDEDPPGVETWEEASPEIKSLVTLALTNGSKSDSNYFENKIAKWRGTGFYGTKALQKLGEIVDTVLFAQRLQSLAEEQGKSLLDLVVDIAEKTKTKLGRVYAAIVRNDMPLFQSWIEASKVKAKKKKTNTQKNRRREPIERFSLFGDDEL